MKKITLIPVLVLFALLTLSSCKSTLYISVLQPATLTLPDNIQKVAVVNRTYPKKGDGNQFINVLEGIVTGEGIMTDRFASEECVNGMANIMLQSPRFELVRPPDGKYYGTGTGRFPAPMSWEEVQKICEQTGADALISLEAFDSNSGITFNPYTDKVKTAEGVYIDVIKVRADARMTVTQGFRVYDYKNKRLIDEFRSDEYMNFNGVGMNPAQATSNLPAKSDMLNRAAFHAGQVYGTRITPLWIRVSREYYNKGNDPLRAAGRKARINDWKGAAQIWSKEVYNKNRKVAARATYNMAIASEVEGKLDLALEWAKKAYTEYNLKSARRYSYILQNRIYAQQKADEQMRSKNEEQPVEENK